MLAAMENRSNQSDPEQEVAPAVPTDGRPPPSPDQVDESDGDEAVFDGYLPL